MKGMLYLAAINAATIILFLLVEAAVALSFSGKFSDPNATLNLAFFAGYAFTLIPATYILGSNRLLVETTAISRHSLCIMSLLVFVIFIGLSVYGILGLVVLYSIFNFRSRSKEEAASGIPRQNE